MPAGVPAPEAPIGASDIVRGLPAAVRGLAVPLRTLSQQGLYGSVRWKFSYLYCATGFPWLSTDG